MTKFVGLLVLKSVPSDFPQLSLYCLPKDFINAVITEIVLLRTQCFILYLDITDVQGTSYFPAQDPAE